MVCCDECLGRGVGSSSGGEVYVLDGRGLEHTLCVDYFRFLVLGGIF